MNYWHLVEKSLVDIFKFSVIDAFLLTYRYKGNFIALKQSPHLFFSDSPKEMAEYLTVNKNEIEVDSLTYNQFLLNE